MKIITIIGARPQFIKAAVVSRAIAKRDGIEEIIVHTGQHYDHNMSDIFFEEMNIPRPHYNLNINGLSHGAMTGQMLEKIEEVLLHEQPDWVLIYGDTNSTIAGALAAKKLHIKVAHVEAGLRSFNMQMPEEINRIVTDRISDILFCPTQLAISNLNREGFDKMSCLVQNVGDVMYDAALYYSDQAKISTIKLPEKYVLCTIHRAENTDNIEHLMNIFSALKEISMQCPVVLPLHPRTRGILNKIEYDLNGSHIFFIDPVGYLEMIALLKNCNLVMTDSGGVQKEAFFFEKICITLREETEWMELVEAGVNQIVGSSKEKIVDSFNRFYSKKTPANFSYHLYGKGDAGDKIIESLLRY